MSYEQPPMHVLVRYRNARVLRVNPVSSIQGLSRRGILAPSVYHSIHYFFPDFLIPCCPAFSGPFPFAFSAISFCAFASGGID